MVGKKQNLSYLTDEERDKIMNVLQKDFELRRVEKKLINEVHDELVKEKNRIAVLKDKDKFNENSCIICLERFGILFHRKRKCHKCDLNICSECSQARDKKKKGFICKVCSKEKAYKMLSNEWFYHSSHATDKHYGSSKIVQWLHKRPAPDPSDTDVDSGYNQSSCSSAGPGKPRSRLENVFDIKIKESLDEELPQRPSEVISLSRSASLEALSPDLSGDTESRPHSETDTSDQITEETITETSNQNEIPTEIFIPKIVPSLRTSPQSNLKSQSPLPGAPIPRSRNIKEHGVQAAQKEIIDQTKKAEESNFRVEFDKLLRDLYETLNDDDLDGLTTNTASPSYEDMMLTFKDKVSDILKGFTDRLQIAYENSGSTDCQENPRQKVEQDVCKFIGGFIGENVNMTPDAAMSDFSAVTDSSNDENPFEDLLAQAVVSKLFDNHYNEVSEALWSSNKSNLTDPDSTTYNENEEACALSSTSDEDINDSVSADVMDGPTEESDVNTEIQVMKEFVKNTSRRPRIEVSSVDDSILCEVNEDTLMKTEVDRDEDKEEFCARFSILDRIHNSAPTLPDISCFDSGDSATDEIDPDLLSLNLAIIPEETEDEVDLDVEKKTNWSFKEKGSVTHEHLVNTNEHLSPRGSLRMRVPIPENIHIPKIGHRNIDQLSDFSDLDGSDDEENTFYANTSKELARIEKQRGKLNTSYQLSDYHSEDSDFSGRVKQNKLAKKTTTDRSGGSYHNSEADVESIRQDIKLLQDLIPAENDDPTFLVAPESGTIQEGEPVKFSCRVDGTGHIDVFWYREGDEVEELEDSSDVDIFSEGDKHSIVLYNLNRKMGGQYMCIAVNGKGKTIQYFVVTVKDNKLELKKPEFMKGLKDVEITEGQNVQFRVKVKGYPQPRVHWYKDGKLLKGSRLCRIEKFGNRDYILAIDHATMNDDAEYAVVARNVAGEEMMSAQIVVEPQTDLPVRKQHVSSTTTSGVSDSDSDRTLSYQPRFMNRHSRSTTTYTPSGNVAQTFISPTLISTAAEQRESRFTFNQEDTSKTVRPKQTETSGTRRLLTDDVLDVLKVAEDIIQQENNSSNSAYNKRLSKDVSDSSTESIINSHHSTTVLSAQNKVQDSLIEEFYLPDSLDDYQLPQSSGQAQYDEDIALFDAQKNKQQVLIDKCSRDFEVPLTAKKKHETPLYGPELSTRKHEIPSYGTEVSTRKNCIDRKTEMGDSSSSLPSAPQFTDSEIHVDSKQERPIPVGIVRHVSEEQTSESPPETSKNASSLLPSVDKLKEVFSTGQDDDDIEVGTLKRVHSITARNVPKEQLEALRASDHNQPSSPSSGKFLKVPESSPIASPQILSESQLTHNKSSASSSDKRLPSSSANSTSSKKRSSLPLRTKEAFTTLDFKKEPVLIYLKTNPEDMQQLHLQKQPVKSSVQFESKSELSLYESNQQKSANQRPLTATKHKAQNQHQQSKIVTQTTGQHHQNENVHSSGPWIKGGCISARTAFWERKIAHGEAGNQEEFPDMVESSDT